MSAADREQRTYGQDCVTQTADLVCGAWRIAPGSEGLNSVNLPGLSAVKQLRIRAVHGERSMLSRRMMRSDLARERQVGNGLLSELDCCGDIRAVLVLALERTVEAIHHAVGLGGVVVLTNVSISAADIPPTRRLSTAHHR